MYIKQDMDFNDLMNNCWSGAIDTLKTIEEHGKEDELMQLLEDALMSAPTLQELMIIFGFRMKIFQNALEFLNRKRMKKKNKRKLFLVLMILQVILQNTIANLNPQEPTG